LSTIFNLFPRTVRDLAKREGKEVALVIEGGETTADKRILEEMKDPLMHMIRNAIDHGIETVGERQKLGKPPVATLRIKGYNIARNIIIEVTDDGRGLNLDRIKETAVKRNICTLEELAEMTENQSQSLIFTPGFSTKKICYRSLGARGGFRCSSH
jgi:Chemotaxis protein histidine kinase and related kinases